MAILYADNIFGLDTNDGLTISTPKKSINGALQISSNGDEIRVAGGSFSQLPGFITNVPRSNTVTTSVDLTVAPYGLTAGDTIGFDTTALDGWPVDYSAWLIASTTPTTITLRTNMWLPVGHGTFSVYKFGSGSQSYHYETTLTTGTFETISSFTASAVTVSGGWNSTFDTQWGWTGVKAGVPASVNSRALFLSSSISKPSVVFDRFLFSNAKFNAGSNTTHLGFNTMIFIGTSDVASSSLGFISGPSASNPDVAMTIIQNGSPGAILSQNTNFTGGGNNLSKNMWISSSNTSGDNSVSQGAATCIYETINYRHVGNAAGTTSKGLLIGGRNDLLYMRIQNLNAYVYATSSYCFLNSNCLTAINNFNLYRPDGTNCQVHNLSDGSNLNYLNQQQITMTTGVAEDLRWQYPSTYTNYIANFQNKVAFTIKDTEGRKVVDCQGVVRFADSSTYSVGTQSMRFNTLKNPPGFIKPQSYYIGATLKPTTNFTLSISAKTNVATLTATPVIRGDGYMNQTSLSLSNITLTPTWTTYTYSVTLANINRTSVGPINTQIVYATDTPDDPLTYTLTIGDTQATYGTQSVYVWIGDISIY
jgi:hypothetical protein